jgi:DNA-binding NtrC family response regulator
VSTTSEGTSVLVSPDGQAGAIKLPSLRVVVARGPDKGRSAAIDKEEIVVGTGPSCDLQLTDPTVSRNHLTLRVTEQGLLVTDLDSTNGTLIEGRRVRGAYVKAGERLDVGATRLRVEATRESAELPLSGGERFGRLLGRSVAMRRLFALVEQVAHEEATVLLLGETGTGKDAVAEAIHEASPRRAGAFVVVDCSTLADGIVESELFGHEKGAFTGADRAHKGAIAEAHGGTLFIDEVGELPRDLQPKLLRALERREVRPVGSAKPVPVDARIIAATNRDLKLDVNRGLFREDLFYRLNVISIRVPPLRERIEDVPMLAHHFWREISGDASGACPDELVQLFIKHRWPGNVRELKNRVERALVLRRTDELSGIRAEGVNATYGDAREAALSTFERGFLAELMARARGNVSEAARLAHMDRVYLTKLLRKHGMK